MSADGNTSDGNHLSSGSSPLPIGRRELQAIGSELFDVHGDVLETALEDDDALAPPLARHLKIPFLDARRALGASGAYLVGSRQGTAVLLTRIEGSASANSARDFTLVPLAASSRVADNLLGLRHALTEIGLGPGVVLWETDAQGRFTCLERDTRGAGFDLDALLVVLAASRN